MNAPSFVACQGNKPGRTGRGRFFPRFVREVITRRPPLVLDESRSRRLMTTMNLCAFGAVASDREGVLGTPGAVTISFSVQQAWAALWLRALVEREDRGARGVAGDGALERCGRIG